MKGLAAFEPLGDAERAVAASLADGGFERLGDGGRPEADSPGRTVRADILRALVVGGEGVPVHAKGVRLVGATVTGVLDLGGCRVAHAIAFVDCTFDGTVVLRGAVLDAMQLDGFRPPALLAEQIEARGDVALRSATVDGPVLLAAGRIGGSLVADGATVSRPAETAFDAGKAEIRGGLFLRNATVEGRILLGNASVGADLEAVGLLVRRPDGWRSTRTDLLSAGIASSAGPRWRGRRSSMARRSAGSRPLGRPVCRAGRLRVPPRPGRGRGRVHPARGRIVRRPPRPQRHHRRPPCRRSGVPACAWRHVAEPLPLRRLPVLARRRRDAPVLARPPGPVADRGRLLAAAIRDARRRPLGDGIRRGCPNTVLFEKERLQRRARRARASSRIARALLSAHDAILLVTVGYGRKAHYANVWLAVLWVSSGLLLAAAEGRDEIRPNPPFILRLPEWVLCGYLADAEVDLGSLCGVQRGLAEPGQSQLGCWRAQPNANAFPRFDPWMYAVDTMLPPLDTQQRANWSPDTRTPFGRFVKGFSHFVTVAGWALSLLAVAAFSGLARSR